LIESRTCLLPMVTKTSWNMLSLHNHYRRRILPRAGGLLDQPNYYREAMEAIDSAATASPRGDDDE